MVKRIAVWIVSICLVSVSGAVCQSKRPVGGVVSGTHVTGSTTVTVNRGAGEELPDAPSAAVGRETGPVESLPGGAASANIARVKASPVNAGSVDTGLVEAGPVNSQLIYRRSVDPAQIRPALAYESVPAQRDSGNFLSKYLEPSRTGEHTRYRASSSDSLMGRATDAASSILVTRDESGRRRLNTSYLVGVLTSVAAHRAEHPYWLRSSASAPLGDFGSTVGNDAGMNLLHEFGPGLREAVTGHMPSFVFRIQQRIARETAPQQPALKPGR